MFTVQKLQKRLNELSKMTEGTAYMLSPVSGMAAAGPMATPSPADRQWQPVEVGMVWGLKHGTSWLRAPLQVAELLQGQPLVLQLHWDTSGEDPLLLRLEATVFLDGRAIGAFDWRHPVLLLPEDAGDGQPHTLMLQVYTAIPLLFGGLTLSERCMTSWQLYHLMETLLEVCLT